jgi:hypothetical protein
MTSVAAYREIAGKRRSGGHPDGKGVSRNTHLKTAFMHQFGKRQASAGNFAHL